MILNMLKNVASERGVAPGFLRPIDTNLIARNLDLDRLATENGSLNSPPSEAETFDPVEQKIIQEITSEWTWHGGELINQLQSYSQRLNEYSVQAELVRLKVKGNNALAQLRSASHVAHAELGPLWEALQNTRQTLDQFRQRHKIERAPRESSNRWTSFGLLFVMIAVESVFNGLFFAEGSEFGLIGGIGTAIGISISNVAFAFILGWGVIRWIHYRNIFAKLGGVVVATIGIISISALHAFAAHLRDATAGVGEERAMSVAIQSLTNAPWQLSSLESFYLFGLGMLFAFLALWKGYTFDDPFPGYGAYWRQFNDARDTYIEEHAKLFDDLETIKEDTLENLDSGIKTLPGLPQQAQSIRAYRDATIAKFRAYESAVQTAANELLSRYRQRNQSARTTPAPHHFKQSWNMPETFLERTEVQALIREPDTPPVNLQLALHEINELLNKVILEYEKLLEQYPHPTQIQ